MKITFYSNYLTHHQIPFCNEMYRLLGNDFYFIATQPMEEERKNSGWQLDHKYKYELKAYESDYYYEKSLELAKTSDAIIIGSAPEIYVTERMRGNKNLTLRYSERIYKRGRWRVLSPRGMFIRYITYFRYINKPLYMLCSSAYTAKDFALTGAYIKRCYKWGYFPETKTYDIDAIIDKKQLNSILWVGRFIDWKHPETAINLAEKLKSTGLSFTLSVIGSGAMKEKLRMMIKEKDLNNYVNIIGNLTHIQVRQQMENSGILIMTSDFNEGWGAVVNEAMNSGCTVVVSHAAGSVPFLVDNNINGCIYTSGKDEQLFMQVSELLKDTKQIKRLGRNAYFTIKSEWNAEIAARRLLDFTEALLGQKEVNDLYNNGPCSTAPLLKNNWRN